MDKKQTYEKNRFLLSKPELGFPLESEELWVIALHEGDSLWHFKFDKYG